MAEPQTRTADKKPEKYVGTDGKTHIRMVPVRKDIVKTEKTMCPQCKGKGCSHCDNTGYHESVDEVSLDAIKKSVTAKNLSKSVNKATNKDKIKMDLAALRKKLATEAYNMNEMVCESCGDTYGKPKTESCMYDAYDKNGKNWVTKKEYLAAQKKNEEVELDEDRRMELRHQSMMFTHAMKQAELKKKDPKLAKQHDMAGKLHAKAADMHADGHKDANKHSDKANRASKLLGESVQLTEAQIISKKPHPDGGHIVKLKTDGGQVVTRHLKNGKVKTMKVHKEEVEEAVGTSAKYAGKSGMFGGKYTSKDRMMDMPLDKLNKIRSKRQAQNKAAHDKQDPKMSKMGYAKHMLDTDKADAKARKRGIDPTGKYDKYKKRNNIKDSVQVDEVLDTPERMRAFKNKAKTQADKARNSATAKIVRGNDDISKEKEILRRRKQTQDRADRAAGRQWRKSVGLGYNVKKESVEVEEKKLTQKQVNRALASIKPSKKKPTLPKAPWDKKEEGYASDAQRKAVWAAKNDKKQQNESVDLSEKLSVGDGMGSWIKDFQASDAPQFAGKSDKEKRNMAIAAYLSKKRGN